MYVFVLQNNLTTKMFFSHNSTDIQNYVSILCLTAFMNF